MMSVLSLPLEVIVHILGYLDVPSLKTVASLHPYLAEIIENNNQVWKILFLKKLAQEPQQSLPLLRKRKNGTLKKDVSQSVGNGVVVARFPSLSMSKYWKTEYSLRFQYLDLIANVNKDTAKTRKQRKSRHWNTYLVVSVFVLMGNFGIGEIIADFYGDKLISYSAMGRHVILSSLKQGKGVIVTKDVRVNVLYVTVTKVCKRFSVSGVADGSVFVKEFSENAVVALEAEPGAAANGNGNATSEKQRLVSYIAINPRFNGSNVQDDTSSLDIVSGDISGHVRCYNYTQKRILRTYKLADFSKSDTIYPVIKIISDFKNFAIVESLNAAVFVINLQTGECQMRQFEGIPAQELATPDLHVALAEAFNSPETLATLSNSLIMHMIQNCVLSFLEVDFANKRLVYGMDRLVYVSDFSGFRTKKLQLSSNVGGGFVQTLIVESKQSGIQIAGNNSALFVALYGDGTFVVFNLEEAFRDDFVPMTVKVVPKFLEDRPDLRPILKFDANSVVLMACSYNGWVALLNILNGKILKIIENKISKNLINSDSFIAPTAVKLNEIWPITLREEDSAEASNFELPKILLQGITVMNNIVQYFHVSFENSLFARNTRDHEEIRKRKGKNVGDEKAHEINQKISEELQLLHEDNVKKLKELNLLNKYNGDVELTMEEEMQLAMALNASLQSSEDLEIEHILELSKQEAKEAQNAQNAQNDKISNTITGTSDDAAYDAELQAVLELSKKETQSNKKELEFPKLETKLPGLPDSSETGDKGKGKGKEKYSNDAEDELDELDEDEQLRRVLELSRQEAGVSEFGLNSGISGASFGFGTFEDPHKEPKSKSKKSKYKKIDLDELNGLDDDMDDQLKAILELSKFEK